MSSEILWYIWIGVKVYLEVGLFCLFICLVLLFLDKGKVKLKLGLKEILIIILFHPVIINDLIKEFYGK